MHRIGESAARVLKTLAGQDRDEPLGPFVIALYCMLFLIVATIVMAWVSGAPLECFVRATC